MSCGPYPHLIFVNVPVDATLQIWIDGSPDQYLLSAEGQAGGGPVSIPHPGTQLFDPPRWSGPAPAGVTIFCTRSVNAPATCTVNARVLQGGQQLGSKQCFVVNGQMGVPFAVPIIAAT